MFSSICQASCFYIGSSSLCSRYLIPSATLQHRHKALFADVALHEIIVCGKQEAAPVLQSRYGVEHEIVLVAARNAEEADFHRFFPKEQRRVLVGFAVQPVQFTRLAGRAHIPAHCTAQSGAGTWQFSQQIAESHPSPPCRLRFSSQT